MRQPEYIKQLWMVDPLPVVNPVAQVLVVARVEVEGGEDLPSEDAVHLSMQRLTTRKTTSSLQEITWR